LLCGYRYRVISTVIIPSACFLLIIDLSDRWVGFINAHVKCVCTLEDSTDISSSTSTFIKCTNDTYYLITRTLLFFEDERNAFRWLFKTVVCHRRLKSWNISIYLFFYIKKNDNYGYEVILWYP